MSSPVIARACQATRCFHCGEPNPLGEQWRLVLDGAERHFCCAGCRGVAQAIRSAGLDAFYVRREHATDRVVESGDECDRLAIAAQASGLVVYPDASRAEVPLLLEGIHCAACVWLIETWLLRQRGIAAVSVNFATRRARVRWDPSNASLAEILRGIASIGYRAYPYDAKRREALARREGNALLLRAGVALLAMMQVMMFAVPAYISADGVEPEYQRVLDWASLALTLPVVLYSAAPFFRNAWRDLRLRRLGMDVPVALGLSCAFVASAWATIKGVGAVYFDSITMFVALLLVARYVEHRARRRAADAVESVARGLPDTAERLRRFPESAGAETVAASQLAPGDIVRVDAGAAIPADGTILEGRSNVEEALLTGESRPRARRPGDAVLAGSINRETPLIVRVDAAGEATILSALARLVEQAANARPRMATIADRVAGWFVAALLAIAALSAIAWWQIDPARALPVALAVLVVSCPCALSLATPAALACVAGALGRERILAVRADAVEALARVTAVVFDKTGTLTTGRLQLVGTTALAQSGASECLAWASALEQGSSHPLAIALRARATPAAAARDIVGVPGLGVEGTIADRRLRLGRPDWAGAIHGAPLPSLARETAADRTQVALADASGWLAWFVFGDALRPSAAATVEKLREMGISISLVSGDRSATVQHVARELGIADWVAAAAPEDKRAFIASRQREGKVVAMVGDGINDAASLAQADVSLSLGDAATLTQRTAAVVVLGGDLRRVAVAIDAGRRAYRVVRQNLAWAFVYNLVAIPLAATGQLTPLIAAFGMAASSLIVVGNALRLLRPAREPEPVAIGDAVRPSTAASA
jgi:P-type Cu2+ transporter